MALGTTRGPSGSCTRWRGASSVGYRFLLFDNDPTAPLLDASDLQSDDVFIFVNRRARSQFADFVDRQLIEKYGKQLISKKARKWVLRQIRHRSYAIRAQVRAHRRRATVVHIRFEDFVTDLRHAKRLQHLLGLAPPSAPQFDAATSRRNLDVTPSVPLPGWLHLGFALLDSPLLRPRTTLRGR